MIESLTLTNFQAHSSTTIEFDPHVTCICGPSDRGKSSIIRALRWVVTNKPGGEAFIRDGAKDAVVSLRVDGHLINRIRGGNKNGYDFDNKLFKAFGNDVPPDISACLNISERSFQSQHDSPFWFGETAGEVSRQLNEIIDLGIIDEVLGKLDKRVRESSTNLAISRERVAQAKQDRAEAEKAVEIDESLQAVEALEVTWQENRVAATLLGELLEGVCSLQVTANHAAAYGAAGLAAVARGEEWAAWQVMREGLENSVNQLRTLAKAIVDRQGEARAAEQEFKTKIGSTCPLCGNKIASSHCS